VANVIGLGIARTIVDAEGDPVNVSDTGNLMVDIGAASISGDLSVNLTQADKVSIWGNEQADGEGTARAILTDDGGRLQVDVIAAPSTAVTCDTAGNLLATVTQQSTARTVTCDTAGNLLATVTQNSAARTKAIAGTVDMGTQVSVGSSTTEIADALGDRMAIIIVNDSDETIYIMLGNDAIMNRGIRLNANGGSFATEMYQGVINGICASGSRNVTVTEISP